MSFVTGKVRQLLQLIAGVAVLSCGLEAVDAAEKTAAEHPVSRTPEQAEELFQVPDGLEIQLVVSEPDVSQPLSISFDDRGRMWVLQYLQYPLPEGLKPVKVDQWLRTEYDEVPEPPPKGPKGKDRISIYEDTDGDGRCDTVKHFLDDLNLASGMALGYGGVFVVQPPYLLFYPDRNHDDVPDSDPEVLLTGFGMEDAHAYANSLTWGPDGWLYGAQGSTATADIRGIGFQQGVWRYHPRTKEFELFAEGGGNTWGLDFDRHGNLFAGGNTLEPLVHHVQGAYYVKGFGKHGPLHNPHTYGYFPPSRHHGFTGDSLTGGFVLYQGGVFPERFHDACIAPNTRHSASRWSTVEARAATFDTRAAGDFITTSDIWFRPVESTVGPDGALYVADWYDYNISHSSPQNRGKWYMPSRFDGRIWRVAPPDVNPPAANQPDMSKLSSGELVDQLSHPNDWYARKARRLLAERKDPSVLPRLRKLATTSDDQRFALQALWSIYVTNGLDDDLANELLSNSPHEYVRAWCVRLPGDSRNLSPMLQEALIQRAAEDPSIVVRSQLACTAKRLPAKQAVPIIAELLQHDADADDDQIPLLVWWAIEDKAVTDRDLVLSLLEAESSWTQPMMTTTILERLARRYAAEGTDESYTACAQLLADAPSDAVDIVVTGLTKGLSGRKLEKVPAAVEAPLKHLLTKRSHDPKIIQLALRLGNAESHSHASEAILESNGDVENRISLIGMLGELRSERGRDALLTLLKRNEAVQIQTAVVSALGYYQDPHVGEALVLAYPKLAPEARARTLELLSGRREWAVRLLEAVAAKDVDSKVITMQQLRQMLQHKDDRIEKLVSAGWGRIQQTSQLEKEGRIKALLQKINRGKGDPGAGATVFRKTCATCHKLHGQGNTVGPDLTGAERKDIKKLLHNIVAPSAMIREQYISHVVVTVEGRLLTGLLAESTTETLTILDAQNKRTVIRRDEVDEISESPISLMPERILEPLTDQQIRDLIAYVQSDAASQSATP